MASWLMEQGIEEAALDEVSENLYLLSSEKGGVNDLQICGCDVDLTRLAASE
ncbi:hypothetical protein ACI65C_003613, partial [Semiaphis heraclei]